MSPSWCGSRSAKIRHPDLGRFAVAEAEQVDEILMGVGRHPRWLRWLKPPIAQGVAARTDIPVAVMARGRESAFERYAVPAGVVGLAALLIAAD